jgi:hypothetical protein
MVQRVAVANVIAGLLLIFTFPAFAAKAEDGWGNLRRVTHETPYTFMLRTGGCIEGHVDSVSQDRAIVRIADGMNRIPRNSEFLRVSEDSEGSIHNAIFSGRSSWADIYFADPSETEYLDILGKDGRQWKWNKPVIKTDSIHSDDQIIAKSEIRLISYVRFTPLTPNEHYFHCESADFLAPRLWFHYALLPKINVLLYNSDLPEDNSPRACPAP